jgi:hypothetical protein
MTQPVVAAKVPRRRLGLLGAAASLCFGLAACSGPTKEQAAVATYCPSPFVVQDTQSLTRFKPGAGRDPRDIAFQASLTGAAVTCEVGRRKLEVNLKLRLAVDAGPSVVGGTTSVPYFVRLLSGGGVSEGQDFNATFKLSAGTPRGSSLEEITLTLPYDKPADLGVYRVAVGLKPTPEELDYNRRFAARQ